MRGHTWQTAKPKAPPKPKVADDVREAADALAAPVIGLACRYSIGRILQPEEFRARQQKADKAPATEFWLNTSSNVRHNQNCDHFKTSKKGRICSPNEGKACGICGG